MTVIKKLLALDCLMVGAVLQRLVWHAHPVYESPSLTVLQESDIAPKSNSNTAPDSPSPHPCPIPAGVSVFQQ